MSKFPLYKQADMMDCGPTCLRMIAKHYGKSYTLQTLRQKTNISREGVSLLGIVEAAESVGFRTLGTLTTYEQLQKDMPLPFVAYWQQRHFIVVYAVSGRKVKVADPSLGFVTYTKAEFCEGWCNTTTPEGEKKGIALGLEPTTDFYKEEDEPTSSYDFNRLFSYLFTYKNLLLQLCFGLLIGSILQLVFPFLTQSIVDIGIYTQDLSFIYIVLLAQIMLLTGRLSVDFIRSWILLHISTRINVSILSDFLIKLMRLPLSFFDVKMMGDIMQRMGDHSRIESFLTNNTLNILFSMFNLLLFSIILAFYHLTIFFVFVVASIFYTCWIVFFLRYRRNLDIKRFNVSAQEHSRLIALIQGMQEIKLANAETQKRWQWEHLQAKLFKINIQNLSLSQYQQLGAFFINEGKNILITFFAAKAVLDGQMTLGAMLSVQYIIGQLNSPIEQMIGFLRSLQDAKLSLERLNEIHTLQDEEPQNETKTYILPENKDISLQNVSFKYQGAGENLVLDNINLFIPEGKTTAIVGMSGSGKTTLLKLLLRFYEVTKGEIKIGEANLKNISHKIWRGHCGVVMQEGFIFSDTIAQNIAVGEDNPDINKIINAIKIANIQSFINELPLGLNTKIGAEGNGISQGQKQRILIARAVYKNPAFILFDEATNALDANNESIIMQNLEQFFKNRTVVIVAHRLSTVKNADNIVVLEKGKIIEQGKHQQLVDLQGKYFELVKNQLELGN